MNDSSAPRKKGSWWPSKRKRYKATADGFDVQNWMYDKAHNEELFLDRDKFIRDFNPEEEGSKDGYILIPPVGATLPSEFENRLTNAVKQNIQGQAENRVALMSRLQSDLQSSTIDDPGPSIKNVTSKLVERTFTRLVEQATPGLTDKARAEFETRREYKRFRKVHKRREEPYQSQHWAIVLSIIVGMIAIEMGLNSFYFRDTNPAGWPGGLGIALAIATVNVFICIFAGATIGKYRVHISWWKASFAWVATVLFFLVLATIHYGVGVLREIFAQKNRMSATTEEVLAYFQGKSFQDLLLTQGNLVALIGMLFGMIAFYEGYAGISDRYPGYSAFKRKLSRFEKRYQGAQEDFLDDVNDGFDDAIEELDDLDSKNERKLENFKNRYRQLAIFSEAHLKELKRAELVYAQLIMAYREANKEARAGTADVPMFFSYPPLLRDDETMFAIDKSNLAEAKAEVDDAFTKAREKILQAKTSLEVDRKRLLAAAAAEIKTLEGQVAKEIGDLFPAD
jgi:hypothetical protein